MSFGVLLIVLVFILWKLVFNSNKTTLYIGIAIFVAWLIMCAVYAVFRYGVAGVGYRYGHVLGNSDVRPGNMIDPHISSDYTY